MVKDAFIDPQMKGPLPAGHFVEIAYLTSEIIGILVFLGGCIVLTGWAFDIPALKSVLPGLVTMKANTAFCFVLIGMALWCFGPKQIDKAPLRVVSTLSVVMLLSIGLATLCEYVFQRDFGIDQLIFKEPAGAVLTSSPGRMAFNTAINFVLIGIALSFSRRKNTGYNYLSQLLTLSVGFISLLSLIGYCYGAAPLYIGAKFSTAMALHASIFFIIAAFGVLLLRSEAGLMREVTCDLTGGRILRRFLPVAILVPVCMGFLKIFGERTHLFGNEFGVSLVAVGNLSIIAFYIYVLSILLNRSDIKRNKTQDQLQKAYEDQKAMQSQLIQSEKMASIGQLAAGVAHEINNPVGFISNNMEIFEQYINEYKEILGMAEALKGSIEAGNLEKARAISQEMTKFEQEIDLDHINNDLGNLIQQTQRGLERIQKIVLDLRTFAREGNDEIDYVKLEEVLDSVLSIVQNELKYKAELKKIYGDTPMVKCSAQKMGQVFINLLINASQAIKEKGKIEVRTYKKDKYVCVDVSDTGDGIAPESIKKVFDPFFTTKPVGQGTGLGLSVSHEIIKKHGGQIEVQSKLGEGTTFTVMLPIN